jgi:hypothetical protein
MNRVCANGANRFCFVCGKVLFLKNKRKHTTHLLAAYMSYIRRQFSCQRQPFPTKSHGNLTMIFFAIFRPSFLQIPEDFYDLEAIGLQVFYS